MVKAMLHFLLTSLLALVCASLAPAAAKAAELQDVALPDGRILSYRCVGKGGPTTILEAGWSADSRAWGRIMARLGKTGQACAFDRAGAGRSSVGPLPRSPEAIARDLHAAASKLALQKPYLLIGHSAGGLYVVRFAQLFPSETGALLLVDPSIRYAGPVNPALIHRANQCLAIARGKTLPDPQPRCGDTPPERMATTWAMRLSELESLRIGEATVPKGPARVLSANKGPDPGHKARLHAMQGALVGVRAEPVESGHMMMFEQPEAIIAAAEDLRRRMR